MIPVLPLRDVVVYPYMVIPLFVGRDRSIQALQRAMEQDKRILLVAQMDASQDNPSVEGIYRIGTVSTILQLLKLPDGTVKVLVEGGQRARIDQFEDGDSFLGASITVLESGPDDGREIEALTRSLLAHFEQYVKLNKKTPPEILASLSNIEDAARLADTVAAHLAVKIDQKQAILEVHDTRERLEHLIERVEEEIDLLQVEKRIRGRVKKQMEKSQREYYLNEQMKAIQKELGDMDESPNEIEELSKRIETAGMSKEARSKATTELNKLKMMSPMSAEATVVRNYVDWLVNVPWKKRTRTGRDLGKAEAVLESDHYGLEKVKERIVEYLAVQTRVKKLKGPILCLVGAPGVGKTSLGQSIARATNRKFVRMSLGGVRDEAEIRGHRRTYIGALPGKIVQNMAKVGVRNPLFLLDEVDKMSMDFRGDPSSALLEVLDPEQNHAFNDHYLEVDYDLSNVMFVATANTLNIPPPLLDRMEVIRLSGYTEEEKLNIALRYLLPRQMENAGLEAGELAIPEDAIRDIIRHYTREAGVRNTEREIAKICRKIVKQKVGDKVEGTIEVCSDNIEKYLGVKRFRFGRKEEEDRVGQVTGLAWTEVGGDLLTIEAVVMSGQGNATYTGQLGDVMQESIQAAMTVVRARAEVLGLDEKFHQERDIHIHVPEGATPKDGPSAGVGMCTAMVSALTGIPVRADVAMTGEITLRGEVLPIGGLKEKLLAALRGGIRLVLIPEENARELVEIPEDIKSNLDIRPVQWIDQVLDIALSRQPAGADASLDEAQLESSDTVGDDVDRGLTTH
ncbi:MAG: endopeptidase La [Thiotrichales bacterium]|nr:endopeptidase La [Thiotrichales bacterium]MCY4285822.1 endopeptidase La [Thiotrichales bacterium]MCY4349265.1 endopeptidase La [Thiotrichales bacterium]